MGVPNPFAPWEYSCQTPTALGQACAADTDCAPGDHCHAVTRTCSAALGKGEPCTSGLACAAGLGCLANPPRQTCYLATCDAQGNNCQQGASTGNPCNQGTCPSGQLCITESEPGGTCADPLPAGSSCSEALGGQACAAPTLCALGSGTCATGGGRGQPCELPTGRCNAGLTCIDPPTGGPSSCQDPLPVGSDCTSGGDCVKGAHCDLGTLKCTANVPVGGKCQNGNECGEAPFDLGIGVDCVRGTCIDTSKAGADCWPALPSQCTGGRVCRKK